jgi:hypothetical protein
MVLDPSLLTSVSGGPYFDPSYGHAYSSNGNFEAQSVAGYAAFNANLPPPSTSALYYAREVGGAVPIALVTGAPSPVSLSAPANAASGQSTGAMLTWQPAAGATNYTVVWSTSSSLSPFTSIEIAGASYAPSGLAAGTTYYWGVIAGNCLANQTSTSPVWSFTTGQ